MASGLQNNIAAVMLKVIVDLNGLTCDDYEKFFV